jgi:tetratricopeptide (TPR) repeat protein
LALGTITTTGVVRAAGSSFDRLLEKAEHLKKIRNNQGALPLYQQLIKRRPGNSQAHAGLGWILFELGQADAGIREEKKAISLNPKNADAHHHLASIYLALNRTTDAADEFEKALKIDPRKECNCGPVQALINARHHSQTK